jgi:predicted enzyme related to lactoylglutathione lyase
MKRCQAFYKTVFGWEFKVAPSMTPSPDPDQPAYVMFFKPDTRLHGGIVRVTKDHMFIPELDSEGCGLTTNRLTMKVEEVEASLKLIESAGGKIIMYAPLILPLLC